MLLAAVLTSWLVAAPPAKPIASSPHSELTISPCDAGAHYQFEVTTCAIALHNGGSKPIHISQGEAKFPWDKIETKTITVPPQGSAYVTTTVNLRNSEGMTSRAFRFVTDEPGQHFRGSEVTAFVQSVLDQSKPTLDFGVVKLEEALPEKSITLTSRAVEDFKMVKILSKPDWLETQIDADGHTIHAKLLASAPLGLIHHDQFVKVAINTPQQKEAWVEIDAEILGDVVPDGNPFQLGLMRSNAKNEFLVRVSSRSGKPFKIGTISVERIKGTATVAPCSPVSESCRLIRLKIANDQPIGRLEGVLNVELADVHKTLPIELVGALVSPKTVIHNLDEMKQQNASGTQSSVARPAQKIGDAIANTIKQEIPPPPGKGPLLRWAVAHEAPIYGYVIYRAEVESGPFVRINSDIIRASAEGADKSGAYQWRDNSAVSGKVYWYQIGVLNRNGGKSDLTQPQRVTAQ